MMMKYTFMRYTLYAVLTYGLMELMRFDALSTDQVEKFIETSWVEKMQNTLLLFSIITLLGTKQLASIKYLLLTILGLFFIREQDAFLDDHLGRNVWKILCGLYALLMGYRLYGLRKSISDSLSTFLQSASSGILFLGFLSLLVFSRLFGRKIFWIAVENTGDYSRNVKNAAEECTELYAYFLILIGVIEFYFYSKKILASTRS